MRCFQKSKTAKQNQEQQSSAQFVTTGDISLNHLLYSLYCVCLYAHGDTQSVSFCTQTSKSMDMDTPIHIQIHKPIKLLKYIMSGCGSKLNSWGYAGFSPCFHVHVFEPQQCLGLFSESDPPKWPIHSQKGPNFASLFVGDPPKR